MRKTCLVARREYFENLRTKTFWIGIFVFPCILVLAILVPVWIGKQKEARRYAVIDPSGWLLQAIEERAAGPDLAKVLRSFLDELRDGRLDDIPVFLRPKLDDLEKLESHIDGIAAIYAQEAGWQPRIVELPAAVREDVRMLVESTRDGFRKWWRELPAAEAKRFAPDSSRARYVRVDVDASDADPEAVLKERLAADKLFAYFVIARDPVEDASGCRYVSKNLTDRNLREWFGNLATEAVRDRRLAARQIDAETARWLGQRVTFESQKVGDTGEVEKVEDRDKIGQFAPAAFVYLLWISIFTIAQMLLTNTIEEKSSRIIEVLLSSVSAGELMAGKILGIASTGLTIVCAWVLSFICIVKTLPYFIADMPRDLDLSAFLSDPAYITAFVCYFLLGYLFYAAFFVGIGSVCNSLKEAQNLMTPVIVVLIVPLMAMIPITEDPNGRLAKILSYIPPFTPFIMMNRSAGPPAPIEYVLTTALLGISVVIAFRAAGRVFRAGILMTGKPPKLREILRMMMARAG